LSDFPRDERGFTVNRGADDERRDVRVLPLRERLAKTLGQMGVRRAVVESSAETREDERDAPKWAQPADHATRRGIPLVGAGGGAIGGTRPDTTVGLDPYTRRRLTRSLRPEKSDPMRPRRRSQ
jgi:hypothetical protein